LGSGLLAVLAGCNTFDDPSQGGGLSFPPNTSSGRPGFGFAGSPVAGGGAGFGFAGAGFGGAGSGGMAVTAGRGGWQPIDAGVVVTPPDDSGSDDAGR
jgi:hypothetical protein